MGDCFFSQIMLPEIKAGSFIIKFRYLEQRINSELLHFAGYSDI